MKVGISLKEVRESNYWLRIIQGTGMQKDENLKSLIKESDELKAILGTIVSKMRVEIEQ